LTLIVFNAVTNALKTGTAVDREVEINTSRYAILPICHMRSYLYAILYLPCPYITPTYRQ